MEFVCDAHKGRTWFRIETQAEADAEAQLMGHAVDRHFQRAYDAAVSSYQSANPNGIERDIGLKAHVRRVMPVFLTLRADDGAGLATAMAPPGFRANPRFRIIIVGPGNKDPYPDCGDAIAALSAFCALPLPRDLCFPYG